MTTDVTGLIACDCPVDRFALGQHYIRQAYDVLPQDTQPSVLYGDRRGQEFAPYPASANGPADGGKSARGERLDANTGPYAHRQERID